MINVNAKQSHMRNDASHEPQSPALSQTTKKPSRLAKTLLALCLLVATQLAWGQDPITVTDPNGTTVGTYSDLGAAINACTNTTGSYTITVGGDADLVTRGIVIKGVTINLESSTSATQRTITAMYAYALIEVNGTLNMTDIDLNGNNNSMYNQQVLNNRLIKVSTSYNSPTSGLTLNRCKVRNTYSTGISVNDGDLDINNSEICDNGYGGLIIQVGNNTTVCSIKNTTIKNNNGTEYGGGISLEIDKNNFTVTLENVDIIGNTATINGGGIHCNYVNSKTKLSSLEMTNVNFYQNEAGQSGGGLSISHQYQAGDGQNKSITKMTNCKVGGYDASTNTDLGNIAGYNTYTISDDMGGGGIYFSRGTLILNKVTLQKNKSNHKGGGLFISGNGELYGCTVGGYDALGNYASDGGGGIFVYEGREYTLKVEAYDNNDGTYTETEISYNESPIYNSYYKGSGGLYISPLSPPTKKQEYTTTQAVV